MQQSQNHPSKLTRRGAMTVAGAAITAAAIPTAGTALAQGTQEGAAPAGEDIELTHKRAETNGINLRYITAGTGPVVLCMHGWPQNHREFFPIIERLGDQYKFIAPDLRGYADSDKPFDG